MIFVALSESADKGELILVKDGMCRFHKRKDGVIVIREIIVLPESRKNGIALSMIKKIAESNKNSKIRAKCPSHYEANGFWFKIGFVMVCESLGVKTWELN